MKRVSHNEMRLADPNYRWQLAISDHPIIEDENGVLRYEANPVVQWVVDREQTKPALARYLLNDMAIAHSGGRLPLAPYMQWYRDMGYSLAGFDEVFGSKVEGLFSDG